jgi:peptide/nickel transport system substrate-binding protein
LARRLGLLAMLLVACREKPACLNCDTVVIAATGEPSSLLPPLVGETVARDISDQVFERLADLKPGKAPLDSTAYEPRLAKSWERVDSLTLRFHLRPGARWHDGRPVTANDVVFSFDAYADSTLETAAGEQIRGSLHAEALDSSTVLVRFSRSYPEQLLDATWHVRVIPAHIWAEIQRAEWINDSSLTHLVGSGPYRIARWEHGQSLTLEADSTQKPLPAIRRVVWRFAPDPDAALNAVLSHEADLMETVGAPDRVARVEGDPSLSAVRYPSAAYGFVGYHVSAAHRQSGSPAGTDILGDRAVRRALNMAVNRTAIAKAIFGPDSKAPPGPMSQLLWIWDDGIRTLSFDTAAAGHELDSAGWVRGSDGNRRKAGRPLRFEILVPATSITRKNAAVALQEAWRQVGAQVSVAAVEFPVFQKRLAEGKFDAYIGAYLDEPSPRGLADQWTAAGMGVLNYGGYRSPGFDSLFTHALAVRSLSEARTAWREAMDRINDDAPALFLYAPTNVAAVSHRLEGVEIDPYSWVSGVRKWKVRREN